MGTYDLRNNGINDVYYADANNSIGYFLGNGNGTFQSDQSMWVFTGPVFVSVGDFDGDGIPDIAACGNASNDITFFKGDGAGHLPRINIATQALPQDRWLRQTWITTARSISPLQTPAPITSPFFATNRRPESISSSRHSRRQTTAIPPNT